MFPTTEASSKPSVPITVNHVGRPRKRLLPPQSDRSFVSTYLNECLDMNLRVYSVLKRRAKNDLLVNIITDFLLRGTSCSSAHHHPESSTSLAPVTFVLPKDLQKHLKGFIEATGCNQACAITAALVSFFEAQGINPYADHSAEIFAVMHKGWQRS